MREAIHESETAPRSAASVGETPGFGLYALLGVMLACWSANFTFVKIATDELPAFLVACLRTVCSGVFMVPLYLIFRKSPSLGGNLRWNNVPMLLAIGVVGLVGNQTVFVLGVSKTTVAHSALLTALTPIFVLLGAAAARHERLSGLKLFGMALAVAGVVVLQLGYSKGGTSSFLGDGLMVVSGAMFAGFSIFGKRAAAEFGIITVNTFAFVGGGLLVLPYTIWEMHRVGVQDVSLKAWLSVLYMSLFPSIVGYLIYVYALRRLPASRVASVSYLQPIFATLLAMAVLGEHPGNAFLAGAALVLSGVWIAQTSYSQSGTKK
jgi:drug/metabolite transporter (DMT)-like permease